MYTISCRKLKLQPQNTLHNHDKSLKKNKNSLAILCFLILALMYEQFWDGAGGIS